MIHLLGIVSVSFKQAGVFRALRVQFSRATFSRAELAAGGFLGVQLRCTTLGRVPKVLALVFFYKERVLAASKMLGIHTVFPALFSLQSLPPCEKSRHPDFRDTP